MKKLLLLFSLIFLMTQPNWATNYYSKSTGNLNLTASWGINTDGTGTAPSDFTTAGNTFNIRNNATPTIGANWTVSGTGSGVVVGDGTNACTFTIPSSYTYSSVATTISNNAIVKNQRSAVTSLGTCSVLSGSTYQHDVNGGTIPTATWNITSTCLVTGVTSTVPGGLTQTFGNFTWNCASQTGDRSLNGDVNNVAGTFTVASTGSGTVRPSGDNVAWGSFSQTGGTFWMVGSSTPYIITVTNNFSISGGTFNIAHSSAVGTLNIGGNFSVTTGGTLTEDGSASGAIKFNGTGDQSVTATGTISNTINFTINKASGNVVLNSNLTINASSTLTFTAGKLLTGSNTVTFNATAILTGEAAGKYLVGNLTTTRSVGSGSTFNFAGLQIGSSTDNLGNVILTRVSGTAPAGTGSKLNRYWDISSTNPPSAGRNITFSWVSDDDGDVDKTVAVVYKSTDNGSSWSSASAIGGQDVSGTRSIVAPGVTAFSRWCISDANNPLPVELTSFAASVKNYSVHLNWVTATESSNYGFEIERSTDKANWSKVAFINGHGNSNSTKQYSYTDSKISSGKYYYRLKQIDADGAFEYSKEIEVTTAILLQDFVVEQNFPNPFNPTTTIKFGFKEPVSTKVIIYNALGSEVTTLFNERAEAGKIYSIDFDGSQLASGIYFYSITGGNFKSVKKMILTK